MIHFGRFVVAVGLVTAGCGLASSSGQPGGDAGKTIHHPSGGEPQLDAGADHTDSAADVTIKDAAGDASTEAPLQDAAGEAAGDAATGAAAWLEDYHASGGLVLDAGTSVLLGGAFSGTADFGGGTLTAKPVGINDNFSPTDGFLAMLEDDGTFRWQLHLAGTVGSDGVDALALDAHGNAVAAGHFVGSITIDGSTYDNPLPPGQQSGPGPGGDGGFVVKRSGATGAAIWSRGLTTPDGSVDPGYLAVAPDGTVVVSGYYSGTFDAGGGAFACTNNSGYAKFIAAYRGSDGGYLWSRCFDSRWSPGFIPAFDSAGALLLVAQLDNESIDFGSGPVTAAGTALVMAKYDGATGKLIYTRTVASSSLSTGEVVAYATSIVDGTDLAIAGTLAGSGGFGSTTRTATGGTDVFVARIAGDDGSLAWSRLLGGANDDSPTAITVAGGGLRVGGWFQGATSIGAAQLAGPHADSDCAFSARLSLAGDIAGASYLGPAGTHAVESLAPAPDGGVFMGGAVQGELDLAGGTVLAGKNQTSLYAARLAH